MPIIGNPLNSVAFLTDSFNGNGSTTAFTMSVAPATSSSILVVITGVTQAPSTYSVVGTTLTFSTAPPSGTANISVRYLGIPASGVTTTAYRTLTEFTATASQTTFTPPSYTVGFIAVYQNGVMLGSTDYTATNGTTVVLAVGALVGDLVTTESFYVSSVLNAIPATAGAVNSTYIANGVTLTSPTITNNIAIGTSDAGIVFNKSGALTNSTLNDYETGTYTPSVSFQTGSATSTSSGTYTKIGRLVLCNIRVTITSVGASGFVFVTVPFTIYTTSQFANGCGSERATTGKQLQAWQNGGGGNSFAIAFCDYTTAAVNGYDLHVSVSFPASA